MLKVLEVQPGEGEAILRFSNKLLGVSPPLELEGQRGGARTLKALSRRGQRHEGSVVTAGDAFWSTGWGVGKVFPGYPFRPPSRANQR